MTDFGYDISDHTDIDPVFGTRKDAAEPGHRACHWARRPGVPKSCRSVVPRVCHSSGTSG
jgi:Alpha amylase, catalytic domain